jgi:hypothetical protein
MQRLLKNVCLSDNCYSSKEDHTNTIKTNTYTAVNSYRVTRYNRRSRRKGESTNMP